MVACFLHLLHVFLISQTMSIRLVMVLIFRRRGNDYNHAILHGTVEGAQAVQHHRHTQHAA